MASTADASVVDGFVREWTVTRVENPTDAPADRAGLDALDDAELVATCRAGRREAFDVLVERHRRAIYLLCYRFVGNHEDAADLSQDVFLRAYRGLARFRGDAAVTTWLYRIGVNTCLNRVSAKPPATVALDETHELVAPSADPVASLARDERASLVREAVAHLPDRQRATLILRVYHERSHKEIADLLGTTEGAAKANLFHALGNLRKRLGGRV
jgi:RNA polymerase sigma-70 factor (ECF subfamily)